MAKNMPAPLQNSRFYCEHCHHEVPFNASICPHCKKTFDAVGCPICKYSGHPDKFLNGCPMCGYLSTTSSIGRKRGSDVQELRRNPKPRKKQEFLIPLLVLLTVVFGLVIIFVYLTRS